MKDIDEVVAVWKTYIDTISDWQDLVKGITPKPSGCGIIYEIPNPIEGRPNEDFCIADMRALTITEPHYHPEDCYEIYFVLQGSGRFVVGTDERMESAGGIIVNPPLTAHFVIPIDDTLVIVAVSTPPFKPENYIVVTVTDPEVHFDKVQFDRLTPAKD